ncbi:MAG: pyridoxal-phosphate dependent enzyme [Bacteriovoracaceae bacterium]|nr:pyridoxal-phosphate dependent enzyme [Bacteriovoracaceae bacterium]
MTSKDQVFENIKKTGLLGLIGNTPMIKVESLSKLTGRDIFMKCENFNPGGTIKDRPALYMVAKAIADGRLKPGMTIVEGTAGNTGIGLAMVGQCLGYKVIVVLPKGQDPSKLKNLALYGAEIVETDAVMYPDEKHFFLVGKKIGTSSPDYWWANQFDNPDNWGSHYETTAPEMWKQLDGKIDHLVCAAGSSGTIAGVSKFFKEKNPAIKVTLVDPHGSGLCANVHKKTWDVDGTYTMAEGVGITRPTENWAAASVDDAFTLPDQALTSLAYWIRHKEGLVMGMSSMLNLSGAFRTALKSPKGSRLVTFMCDGGDRATGKMYSSEFLKEKNLDPKILSDQELVKYFESL